MDHLGGRRGRGWGLEIVGGQQMVVHLGKPPDSPAGPALRDPGLVTYPTPLPLHVCGALEGPLTPLPSH